MATKLEGKGGYNLEVLGQDWELIGLRLSCEVVRHIMQDEPGPLFLCRAVDGRC